MQVLGFKRLIEGKRSVLRLQQYGGVTLAILENASCVNTKIFQTQFILVKE